LNPFIGTDPPEISVVEKADKNGLFYNVTLEKSELLLAEATVIISPRVDDGDYPDNAKEISLFLEANSSHHNHLIVRKPSVGRFIPGRQDPRATHIGFNLLVLNSTKSKLTRGIKHGFINEIVNGTSTHRLKGLHEPNIIFGQNETKQVPMKHTIVSFERESHDDNRFGDIFPEIYFHKDRQRKSANSLEKKRSRERDIECFKLFQEASVFHHFMYDNNDQTLINCICSVKKEQRIEMKEVTAMGGGVRIKFDQPFDELPSVIVTPVLTEESACRIDDGEFEFKGTSTKYFSECLIEDKRNKDINCCIWEGSKDDKAGYEAWCMDNMKDKDIEFSSEYCQNEYCELTEPELVDVMTKPTIVNLQGLPWFGQTIFREVKTIYEKREADTLQCQVETITPTECFVKCTCIREIYQLEQTVTGILKNLYVYDKNKWFKDFKHDQKYTLKEIKMTPVPFNIVAIGPSSTTE
jgi:hypothetical protein